MPTREMIELDNRIDKRMDSLVAALSNPIIVFDPSWADVLPEWLKGEIRLQGLAELMKGEEGIATDAEALAYVLNAGLAVSLDSEWLDICQYLLTKEMKDNIADELRKENLDDWRMSLLRELKEWIWNQRVKARKQRRKEERAKTKAEAAAKGQKQLGLGL